jgi:hypothetical protein
MEFDETVKARVEADAEFRAALLSEAVEGLCCKFSCGLRFSDRFNAEGMA